MIDSRGDELAKVIFRPGSYVLVPTDEWYDRWCRRMANNIIKNAAQNDGRDEYQIRVMTSMGKALETVLGDEYGWPLFEPDNEEDKIDHTDPESYVVDVKTPFGNIDCKKLDRRNYVSMPQKRWAKLRRNVKSNLLDFLVAGQCIYKKGKFWIRYRYIIDASFLKDNDLYYKYVTRSWATRRDGRADEWYLEPEKIIADGYAVANENWGGEIVL